MGSAASRVGHVICLAELVTLTTHEGALAQATGTINGRVLDQAEAVLPGVTVTATNVNTGVTRSTVTNAEGFYSLPGLEPGLYTLTTELTGFASIRREGVSLTITATVTIDLMLGLAPRAETVTVAGQAPLIEVTQSKVTATIRAQEVENLPLLNRRLTGLIALLPGAKEVTPYHYGKLWRRVSGQRPQSSVQAARWLPWWQGGAEQPGHVSVHASARCAAGVLAGQYK